MLRLAVRANFAIMSEPYRSESVGAGDERLYRVHELGPTERLSGAEGAHGEMGSTPAWGGADGGQGTSGWHGTGGAHGVSLRIAIENGKVTVLESSRATTGVPEQEDVCSRIFIDAAGGHGGSGGRGGAGGSGRDGHPGTEGESATSRNSIRNGRDGGDGGTGGNGGNGGDGGNGSDGGNGGHVTIIAATAADLLPIVGIDVSAGRAGRGGAGGTAGLAGAGGRGGEGGRGRTAESSGRRFPDGNRGNDGKEGSAGRRGRDGSDGKPGKPGRVEIRVGSGRSAIVSDRVYSGALSVAIADSARALASAISADPRDEVIDTDSPGETPSVATVRSGMAYAITANLALGGPMPFPADLHIEYAIGDDDFARLATIPRGAEVGRAIPVRGQVKLPHDMEKGRYPLIVRAIATHGPSIWLLRCRLALDVLPIVELSEIRVPFEASFLDEDVPVELEVRLLPSAELTPGSATPSRIAMEVYGSIGAGPVTSFSKSLTTRDVSRPGSVSSHYVHVPMPTSVGFADPGSIIGDGPDWSCVMTLMVRFTDPDSGVPISTLRIPFPITVVAPFMFDDMMPTPAVGVPVDAVARRRLARRGMRACQISGGIARTHTGAEGARVEDGSLVPRSGPSQARQLTRITAAADFGAGQLQGLKVTASKSARDLLSITLPAGLLVTRIRPDGTAPDSVSLVMGMRARGPAGDARVRVRSRLPAPITPIPTLLRGTLPTSIDSPNDLSLEFERSAALDPQTEVEALSVQVRAQAVNVDGGCGEWVTACRMPDSAGRMVYSVQLEDDLASGVSVPLNVRVCIGGTPIAAWDAEVARVAPRSRRLQEALLALVGGAAFAQKFVFANRWVAISGILLTLLLQWPIGAVIGLIEGIALLFIKDSTYLKHLQRPRRWW